ncbi:MAG: flavodoxin domain-containing protein [Kofleriaceae bacterium]
MRHILIVFASSHGQTRAVVEAIERVLQSRHFIVEMVDCSRQTPPSPEKADAVVLASRIQFGHHASSVLGYIRQHRAALEAKPTVFVSVSMAAADGGNDPNGYLAATFEAVAWKPTKSYAVAGKLAYRSYNWFLRFIMKRISQAAGHSTDTSRDHEYTNWDRVASIAAEIATLAPHGEEQHAS